MIYQTEKSGVFKVENDVRESQDFTIGYRVNGIDKEATLRYVNLPKEIQEELSKVANKIARYAEENSNVTKAKNEHSN